MYSRKIMAKRAEPEDLFVKGGILEGRKGGKPGRIAGNFIRTRGKAAGFADRQRKRKHWKACKKENNRSKGS